MMTGRAAKGKRYWDSLTHHQASRSREATLRATLASMARRKHPWIRRMLGFGVVAGAAYAVWRAIEANQVGDDRAWEPQPFPFPPQPRAEATRETPADPIE
jgi:hypothetical protein